MLLAKLPFLINPFVKKGSQLNIYFHNIILYQHPLFKLQIYQQNQGSSWQEKNNYLSISEHVHVQVALMEITTCLKHLFLR